MLAHMLGIDFECGRRSGWIFIGSVADPAPQFGAGARGVGVKRGDAVFQSRSLNFRFDGVIDTARAA
ncbi:MAG: hypothetical protein M0D54_02110 [Hyphomonadaceae bacterium JAD_PAG50586_4]|nr:MAG: hypothetical protein M0D54_02110 [Hyphomonadaceae bacterium JAD_PAG50586_4]